MNKVFKLIYKALLLSIKTIISILLLFIFTIPCFAQETYYKQVTVAFIDYNNFISKDANDKYCGYGVEYLNNIAEITKWNYKFVEMDWPSAYESVKNGTIDFYCVARQTEDRQNDFDFSLYPIINEEMKIYTTNDRDIYYEDYSFFNHLKIGMLTQSGEIVSFKEYAEKNNFSYTLVEYPTNEDVISALEKNEVDAIAIVGNSLDRRFKLIGNFGVAPAYVMGKNGSQYIKDFSKAQEKLYYSTLNLIEKLQTKYYANTKTRSDILLTREESNYINNTDHITVAISKNLAPIEYYDEKSKQFKGLTIDILNEITKISGLSFLFVPRNKMIQTVKQFSNNEVQLTGASAKNDTTSNILRMNHSIPITESSFLLISKKDFIPKADSSIAIPRDYYHFETEAKKNGFKKIVYYESQAQCVHAVNTGEVDCTYIISLCQSYLLSHVQYAALKATILNNSNSEICFGLPKQNNSIILGSIISKCISAIPINKINNLIIENTSKATAKESVLDFLMKNIIWLLLIVLITSSFIFLLIARRQKEKHQNILRKQLQEHHDFLQNLYDTLPCGVFQYKFEEPHTIEACNSFCAKLYGYNDENYFIGKEPKDVVSFGTEKDFLENFKECKNQQKPISFTWPIQKKDGTTLYTDSIMSIVENKQGKTFQEVFIDSTKRVHEEQVIQKQYMDELNKIGCKDKNLLYVACFDITKQKLESSNIDVPGIVTGISIQDFFDNLDFELISLQTSDELQFFKSCFDFEKLSKDYENGHFEQNFEICRIKDNKPQWLKSNLIVRINPTNGHLMCFDYIWDITDGRVSTDIARLLAFTNCEYILCIYGITLSCLEFEINNKKILERKDTIYGENDILSSFSLLMSSKESTDYLNSIKLSTIQENLENNKSYQVYATLKKDTENRQDKSLTFFYLNEKQKIIAVSISDVTKIRASEIQRSQLLSMALENAEKADIAKSQFLSRVSHELRTPLNAIIGFIELSKDAEKEKVLDYLNSCNIAAKQLLNVINDVLDMSSIESGKLKISNADFNFKQLISEITNIYGPQCKEKNIDFETKIRTTMDDFLIGDELRVNQILMNILGNAIKFTKEGHIWLTISEKNIDGNKIYIHFEINDTGCGMSDEMKSRLFKPFEQESSSTARKYGGSGLGLSIVKNLISLMKGSISVESTQNIGTTFIIDLPFTKSKKSENKQAPNAIKKLRILAVDDTESEINYISQVLTRIGVRFTCASSGKEALDELQKGKNENDLYNICLIDMKMPNMNGSETTKIIKEKYGKDVAVVIISAYDFLEAREEAKAAGANLFISKPIFQSTIFDLLMELTQGDIAKPKQDSKAWDFSGKRALLAEDNTLNQIVAKGYLTKFNLIVDIATNGQEALSLFEKSPKSYYDLVLMDIQMPIMDGFEASKRIRASKHPDAKTIPIIAQTADAFNEDISKALSSGMNFHVSKPIKPDTLANAIHQVLKEDVND